MHSPIPPTSVVAPTVAEILDLAVIQEGSPEVIAAADQLDAKVRWVHISELADIGALLDGGELILTTGVGLPETAAGLSGYIDNLADAGVSGLMIEMGRRYSSVPDALVSRSEDRGLPLIRLSDEIRFIDVTLAVHSLIIESQTQQLRSAAMIHQAFTALSVEGASPQDIIDEARRITGHDVVLENLAHQVLLHSTELSTEDVLANWGARSRRLPKPADSVPTGVVAETWLETSVQARGNRWGRLIIVVDPATDLDRAAMTVLERCAESLALNRLVEREQYSLAHQAQSSILADIVGGTFSSSAEVYSRARALGIDLINRDFVGLTVRVEGRSQPVDILEHERVSRADAERVSGAVETARLPTLVGTLDEDRVNLLIAIERGHDSNTTLLALASSIHRSFAVTATARATIGVGSVVQNLREVRRSFVEAEQAAAAAIGPDRPFNRLSDVRIRGLTRLLRQDPRLQTFIERELGELIAYDEAHGTDLIEVLDAYLTAGGNKSVAARAMSLSRPAFYHRMAKIEAAANMDLESPESRTSLHLALLSLEAIREPSGLPGTDGRHDRD